MNHNIIILTGEIQTGKTSWLQQWVNTKDNVVGILSPIVNDKRTFYDIEKRELFPMEAVEGEEEILAIGKYSFSRRAFDRASTQLIYWSENKNWDYLVVDEIGPLELIHKKGLYNPFVIAIRNLKEICKIIVVVRTPMLVLMDDLLKNLNISPIVVPLHQIEAGVVHI